jgi:hypothetical protein
VPRTELDACVADLAEKFGRKLPEALRYTKTQLNWWRDLVWSQTITHARDWLAVHSTADETKEAVAAFHEKRVPRYAELRAMAASPRVCGRCGATGLPAEHGFCGVCGAPLASAWEAPAQRATTSSSSSNGSRRSAPHWCASTGRSS